MTGRTREQIIDLVQKLSKNTIDNGCTPEEAAKFAAKVSVWVEEYQISEAELRAAGNEEPSEIEVCEHILRTGKKVFNPGMSQVVYALAKGFCCQCISLKQNGEAVYGITGEVIDASYVCQLSLSVVPALQIMARLDGIEHGHEGGALIAWANQYLTGAGIEILRRLEEERKARSREKERLTTNTCTGLIVTGETLAVEKRAATERVFRQKYPTLKTTYSRSRFDEVAHEAGRAAGRDVGLRVGLESK